MATGGVGWGGGSARLFVVRVNFTRQAHPRSCDDAFFGLWRGPSTADLNFKARSSAAVQEAVQEYCEYVAEWPAAEDLPPGEYFVHVWLTHANKSAILRPSEYRPSLLKYEGCIRKHDLKLKGCVSKYQYVQYLPVIRYLYSYVRIPGF